MQERPQLNPWVRKIPQRRERLPTPVFWPGESHGQRSLVGYSPWGCKEWGHHWVIKHSTGLGCPNCSSQKLPDHSHLFIFQLKTRESAYSEIGGGGRGLLLTLQVEIVLDLWNNLGRIHTFLRSSLLSTRQDVYLFKSAVTFYEVFFLFLSPILAFLFLGIFTFCVTGRSSCGILKASFG